MTGLNPVDKVLHGFSTLGTFARLLDASFTADVIVVLHHLLQTVHTLSRSGKHLVLPVLDLPLYHRGALSTAVDNLQRLETLGLWISPVFVKLECRNILVLLSRLLLLMATRPRTHPDIRVGRK